MKKIALLALALVLGSSSAYAGGTFPTVPIAGGSAYNCSSGNGVQTCTVPAGPSVTGNELMPADTSLTGGLYPQTVLIPLNQVRAATYAQSTPVTGFSITVPATTTIEQITPAGTLATGTFVFPTAAVDGQRLRIFSSAIVTALTLTAGTGQTIVGGVTALAANTPVEYVYSLSTLTWYRIQ